MSNLDDNYSDWVVGFGYRVTKAYQKQAERVQIVEWISDYCRWGCLATVTAAPRIHRDGINGWHHWTHAMQKANKIVSNNRWLRNRPLIISAEKHLKKTGVRDRWHIHFAIGDVSGDDIDLMYARLCEEWCRKYYGISQFKVCETTTTDAVAKYCAKYAAKEGHVRVRLRPNKSSMRLVSTADR